MHESVLNWGKRMVDKYRLDSVERVLEVGSLNINGSLRPFFSKSKYIGIDMQAGAGVDIQENSHDMHFENESFDLVICTEMLEHDNMFWLTLKEIGRVLKTGGKLLLTTRSNGFQEHGFPHDYYRFMPNSAGIILELARCRRLEFQLDPQCAGIFILGEKLGSD